ncbi:hydroxydechloroatrazine ethylaminohydrolase [Neosynechococcus sphagnicola sy1]|uniref:Hydroxydechloroatrazine ethylaminohydrolase n=1 Tax=Neosynechococcus sphagnicola sy1 TaxID=1497020 RepID=A0A098TJW9_9CYAN|nr:8-oxoguanine deaminase [Neosynechococcus sphagnicola]KGF72630.1 hydroxydechloroatrazine ethylaminohydrolase [Neosynechococcus sphagnicola sy1]
MRTLLAKNAEVLVTMDGERRELKDAGIYAEDGMIKQVGPMSELPGTADTVVDCSGQIVLPGFVNTHHHLNQTLTRNLPAAQNNNLFPWLKGQYRIWANTTPEASRLSVLIGLGELALTGCTTVFDHSYIFKNGNSVDCLIDAAKEIGVRFHCSRGSMSLGESKGGLPPDDCVEDEDLIMKDSIRAIERYHDPSVGAMTRMVIGPCSPFSVTPGLLKESAQLARHYKVGLHTHLCETFDEERFTLDRFELRPVDWMETLDWLGDDVWFAHAIHVDDDEIQKFSHTGCGVAHCPNSNMRLASGISPIKKYMAAGVKVGLGVDGSASNDSSNMLLEVRQAMLLARLKMGLLPPEGPQKYFFLSQSHPKRAGEWMTARESLEIATLGGPKVLGRDDVGSLEPGKCADFFTIKLHTIDYAGALHDPVAAVVFCAPQKANYTVINGRVIVDQGRIATVDMEPVVRQHNQWCFRIANQT